MSDLKQLSTGDLFRVEKDLKQELTDESVDKERRYALEVELCWLQRELDYRNPSNNG